MWSQEQAGQEQEKNHRRREGEEEHIIIVTGFHYLLLCKDGKEECVKRVVVSEVVCWEVVSPRAALMCGREGDVFLVEDAGNGGDRYV